MRCTSWSVFSSNTHMSPDKTHKSASLLRQLDGSAVKAVSLDRDDWSANPCLALVATPVNSILYPHVLNKTHKDTSVSQTVWLRIKKRQIYTSASSFKTQMTELLSSVHCIWTCKPCSFLKFLTYSTLLSTQLSTTLSLHSCAFLTNLFCGWMMFN